MATIFLLVSLLVVIACGTLASCILSSDDEPHVRDLEREWF